MAAFRVLSALLFLAGSQTALGARWQLLKALLSAAGGGVGEREERKKGRVGKGGNGTRNVATRRAQLTSENFRCHGTQVPPPGGALLHCSSPRLGKPFIFNDAILTYSCAVSGQVGRLPCVQWFCSGVCSGVRCDLKKDFPEFLGRVKLTKI